MIQFILLVFITVVQGTVDLMYDEDYCYKPRYLKHLLPNEFGFTRWQEDKIHVLENTPLFIPCCISHYSSIEWFLNDASLKNTNSPFSVSKNNSRFITSQRVQMSNDMETYKCIAFTHDGKNLTHKTKIFVYNAYDVSTNKIQEKPLALTYPSNKNAIPGSNVSFHCSAFLGFGPLEIYNKKSINWTITPSIDQKYYKATQFNETRVSGGSVIIGSVLEFPNVLQSVLQQTPEVTCNFGGANNPVYLYEDAVDPTKEPTMEYKLINLMLMSVVICIVTVLILAAFVINYHIEIRMLLKDRFAPLEDSGDFDYDVFVCYNSEDGHDTVGKVLLPKLERFGYKCFVYERDAHAGSNLSLLLPMALKRSRRMLIVVSPGLFCDGLALHMCHVGVQEAISNRSLRIMTVLPSRMKKQKLAENASTEALRSILRVSRHVTLPKNPKKMQRFWYNLRLSLPPRRKLPTSTHSQLTSEVSASLITHSLKSKNIDDRLFGGSMIVNL